MYVIHFFLNVSASYNQINHNDFISMNVNSERDDRSYLYDHLGLWGRFTGLINNYHFIPV